MPERILTRTDILTIPRGDLPLLAFSDDAWGWLGLKIRVHCKGWYNHTMWLWEPGILASQTFPFYTDVPLTDYLTGRHRLKLVQNRQWTWQQRVIIRRSIAKGLAESRFKRFYDPLALLGHKLGIPWLQSPWHQYCSERVGNDLRKVEPKFDLKHPSPTDINRWCKKNRWAANGEPAWDVYGRYIPDAELVPCREELLIAAASAECGAQFAER